MILKDKENIPDREHIDTTASPPEYRDGTAGPSEPNAPSYEASGANLSTANSGFSISDAPPPDYALQSNFKIGKDLTPKPLVSAAQLQLHLDLLRAFKELRTRVETGDNGFPDVVQSLEPERRWLWFLELAAARFQLWTENLTSETKEDFFASGIPPLDVWMVWHSYMLNPEWYAEDIERLPSLKKLKNLSTWDYAPLEALEKMGDFASYKPSEIQNSRWVEATGLPFDPFESANSNPEQPLVCPKCSARVKAPYIAFDGNSGVGYAQDEFRFNCRSCKFEITKESLAVAKFAVDMARDPSNLKDLKVYGNAVYLPGTLRTSTEATDVLRARLVKNSILRSAKFETSEHKSVKATAQDKYGAWDQDTDRSRWEHEIKEGIGYKLEQLRNNLAPLMRAPMLRRILGAYSDGQPFSVELVGAVLRQGSFVDKMDSLGWTKPDFFSSKEDQVVLHHCVARYHAFLDLMSSSPTAFFVPTLDIDLGWHTHQLSAGNYANDCKKYIKRFVNHDDKVEEAHLSTAFDVTCRAWQQRFGVRYMHCGCPLPGDTIGQKLSKLTINLSSNKNPINPPPRDDCFLATHPSDHNSVYIENISHSMRQKRAAKTQKRRERDLKKVKDGKMTEEEYQRGAAHDTAFLVPIPFYYTPIVPFYGGVGCAAGVSACTGAGAATCASGGCSGGSGGGCSGGGCGRGGCGGGGGS